MKDNLLITFFCICASLCFGFYDDFDDGSLDPSWSINFNEYCDGWTYSETGTRFIVTDLVSNVTNTGSGDNAGRWTWVSLARPLGNLSDFDLRCKLSWDSAGTTDAIQRLFVDVVDPESNTVLSFGYDDAWLLEEGYLFTTMNGTKTYLTPKWTSPLSGEALFTANRTGNQLSLIWNGQTVTAENDLLASEVRISFWYYKHKTPSNRYSIFGSESVDFIEITPGPVSVPVDIKPGSCPNPLNVKSKGVLPVAILGTAVFDVNEIDPNTIYLAGVFPIKYSYEDVASAPLEEEECRCTTKGPDGFVDLTLKFDIQEIINNLGEVADGDEWILNIVGLLHNGSQLEGTDCVLIKNR